VAAGMRTPTPLQEEFSSIQYDPKRLLVVRCDVTDEDSIREAFDRTIDTFGRCDVVFNGAAYAIFAEVESTPEDAARTMFDVNFWGAANVSREAIRVFRDVNPPGEGGRLLNVSSAGGFTGLPTFAYYSARYVKFSPLKLGCVELKGPSKFGSRRACTSRSWF
jgi:NAD(P)-dependent dehydrogenase (short-subunit alcohol dehydrogenase family)